MKFTGLLKWVLISPYLNKLSLQWILMLSKINSKMKSYYGIFSCQIIVFLYWNKQQVTAPEKQN